jgi:mono/diheme cytochrome c family protein
MVVESRVKDRSPWIQPAATNIFAMPAFGQVFTDAQIDAIVKYVRSLKLDRG